MIVDVNTWFIARNNDNTIIHYGYCSSGTSLDSGQPIVETFFNESEWSFRLNQLGINI